MKTLEYINEFIQGLIIILLIFNAIKTQTLTLYQIIVTLIGILFNFYVKYVSKSEEE